jgi:hypothetical protein
MNIKKLFEMATGMLHMVEHLKSKCRATSPNYNATKKKTKRDKKYNFVEIFII